MKWAQRASPAWKEAWQRHCDQNLNGVRDPTKHDLNSLQQFLGMIGAGAISVSNPLAHTQLTSPAATQSQIGALQPPSYPNIQQAQAAQLAQTLAYAQGIPQAPLGMPFSASGPALVPQGWSPQLQASVQPSTMPDMAAFAAVMGSMSALPTMQARWPAGMGTMTGLMEPTDRGDVGGCGCMGGMSGGLPGGLPGGGIMQAMGGGCRGMAPSGPMLGGLGGLGLPALENPGTGMANQGLGIGGQGGQRRGLGAGGGMQAAAPNNRLNNNSAHARLVQQVKQLQRSSEALKAHWHEACDSEKGGVRDPSRHDIAFLQRFVAGPQASGVLAAMQPGNGGMGGCGGMGPMGQPMVTDPSDPLHASLVQQVKKAQRSGLKDTWRQHCDTEAGGMRDPARHPVTSLRRFLDGVELDEGDEPPQQLVPSFSGPGRGKGRGKGDFVPGGRGGGGKGKGGRGGGGFGGGGQRPAPDAQLVEKVKAAQRISPECKALWRRFCDEAANSVYDPQRHDDSFLQRFLEQSGMDGQLPVSQGSQGRGPVPGRTGGPRQAPEAPRHPQPVGPVLSRVPAQARPEGRTAAPVSVMASSPNPVEPLIERVKQAQKISEEAKAAWHRMCDEEGGGIRDPRRHDTGFLMRFLEGVSMQGQGLSC